MYPVIQILCVLTIPVAILALIFCFERVIWGALTWDPDEEENK